MVLVAATGGAVAFAAWPDRGTDGAAVLADDSVKEASRGTGSDHPATSGQAPYATRATPGASATPSPEGSASRGTGGVATSGAGTFSTAYAHGNPAGHGRIRRYKVQVEDGLDLPSDAAAAEIAAILSDPRGWTADGRNGFQLVSSGPVDFVIKIATPGTVDAICGSAGLLTRGEVNCDVGSTVVVNLKRWMLGSPRFDGPIKEYRALIINHEVGHRIGHGHEACPGPGRPAPVMMQQIKGLNGCKANAWPYDGHGNYLRGPRRD